MNNIYLVVSGCYSDWEVLGFCSTKEDAEQYAASLNVSPYQSDPAYVMEVDKITLPGPVPVMYRHNVHIYQVYKKGVGPTNEWNAAINYGSTELLDARCCEAGVFDMYKGTSSCHKFVYTHTNDPETIEKVVKDYMYQWLAEKNGLA